ncbi:HEAT repeat domain-containing protein, partial [Verrucomicrobiota bacterium]
ELKTGVLGDRETMKILQHFALVEIDVTKNETVAETHQVRGVPTILILSSDGRVRDGVSGYVSAVQLRRVLERALNPEFLKEDYASFRALLQMLESGTVPSEEWPDIMIAMGTKGLRKRIHDSIFSLDPFPYEQIVGLLEHSQIAVRLGSLEIIEEVTGETFGFDPWLDESSRETNAEALARLRTWEEHKDGVKSRYSALNREELSSYIQDLISDNRERAIRAMRMLEHAGPDMAMDLADFLDKNPDLPTGVKKRVKEVQYSLLLPPLAGVEPSVLAHRLVFGNLDVRLRSITSMCAIGLQAVPIASDFLEDKDPIVRETAVDVLAEAGGRKVALLLEEHLGREKDTEVVYAILKGMGKIRSKLGLGVLTSYLTNDNEDLVIVALGSIARLKTKKASKEVGRCLEDPRWRVRVAALDAVAKLKLRDWKEKVGDMLSDEDNFVRYSAVKCLAIISSGKKTEKLEEAFLRDDMLKGPIVEAFGSIDKPLPKSFGEALEGKSPEVIMAVVDGLKGCGKSGLKLATRYVDHDNLDVACAAIRVVGSRGMAVSRFRGLMVRSLQSDRREILLAALESISIKDEDIASHRTIEMSGITRVVTGSSEAAPAKGTLDGLFEAFEGQAPAERQDTKETSPNASPQEEDDKIEKPAPEKAKEEKTNIADIFSAFDDAGKTGSETGKTARTRSSGGTGLSDLITQTEACFKSQDDDEIRFAAALLLAHLGEAGSLSFLADGLSSRTVEQRSDIARSLKLIEGDDVLPLFVKLLRDPSEAVRKNTAEAMLGSAERRPEVIDLIFEELLRDGTSLKPQEVCGYRLNNVAGKSSVRRQMRKWTLKMLEDSRDTALQNFALVVLERCWKSVDEKIVGRFLDSEDPFQRRAAFHTLGKCSRSRFEKVLSKACEDASEYVRMVVPSVYTRGSQRWVHYFDKTHFYQDHYWTSSSSSSYGGAGPALSSGVKDALLKLMADASPMVRVEAFLCLLSNRTSVDLAALVNTINSLPDSKGVGERVGDYLVSNYQQLGDGFKILLPYLRGSNRDEGTLDKVRRHFSVDPDAEEEEIACVARKDRTESVSATFLQAPEQENLAAAERELKVVYFTSSGCSDCARVERMFPRLHECFSGLRIDSYDIAKVDAMRLNEALCEKFDVPEKLRLVTPAVFSGGGYLIKTEISFSRLAEMVAKSAAVPLSDWYDIPQADLQKAEEAIGERYSAMGLGIVLAAGLLDGVNPCAFATIIFLLSYLQITRRKRTEIAQVGLAFTAGVFLAYLALGLGLVEVVTKVKILQQFSKVLNWSLGAIALLIMALSIRDGVLCLRRRPADMTLQLPEFLKRAIHALIRRGARQAHFVVAAFVMGLVISVLELACTGQVYAPTILFILRTGKDNVGAVWNLVLYNLSFVAPLAFVFLLTFYGMRHEALTRFLHKHAALVKFCTAGLFLVLFVFFVFGGKLAVMASSP